MRKKEIVAMILAGGQGSRLGILTDNIAKPAIPYGGKYRIIDFTLSNCINSDIDIVGVLTQYQPLKLNSYIGTGMSWDLDRKEGGVTILPPYTKGKKGEWYKGTADAIYQNMNYIEQYEPQYVLVLSGDHIYKMDYSSMVEYHKEKGSSVTLAAIEVPSKEANRFGIINTKENSGIIEFEEKPLNPKSNLASMGIYIFNWPILKKYLIDDSYDTYSSHDFGKNIIPKMLKHNESMYAYPFKGYWKDVGTIYSLWEANMDLLEEDSKLNLYDSRWTIYTQSPALPPHFAASSSEIKSSIVAGGSVIYGKIENSVIFPGVYIGSGSIIKNSVVMSNVHINNNVEIDKTIINEGSRIEDGSKIGWGVEITNELYPDIYNSGITVIGENVLVSRDTIIGRNAVINEKHLDVNMVCSGQCILKAVAV